MISEKCAECFSYTEKEIYFASDKYGMSERFYHDFVLRLLIEFNDRYMSGFGRDDVMRLRKILWRNF